MITRTKAKTVFIAVSALVISTLGCNLQGSQLSSLAATGTAQALTLQAPPGVSGPPAEAPTFTPSFTPAGVEVSVSTATNCRTGPGSPYDQVYGLNPGETAQVVGKYTPGNYWIINMPGGGTCWLWGQYATITGDPSGLPEYPVPPTPTPQFTPTHTFTPTPASPQAPSNLSGAYDRTCEGETRNDGTPGWVEDITLTWQDNANNETGYRVYKNNSAVPVLPPNSTSYHIILHYQQGTGPNVPLWDAFAVEAFNDAGASARIAVDVPRCP